MLETYSVGEWRDSTAVSIVFWFRFCSWTKPTFSRRRSVTQEDISDSTFPNIQVGLSVCKCLFLTCVLLEWSEFFSSICWVDVTTSGLFHRLPSRSRRRRGRRCPFRHSHVLVVQPQSRVPPLHHGHGHGQRPGGRPHGRGSDQQRQPGVCPAALTGRSLAFQILLF